MSFGPNHSGGEVYFQPRDGVDLYKDEDDGYCMTVVHDWKLNQSQFVMWDSKKMNNEGEDAEILRANLDYRVPYGFHSTFVHQNDY